MKPFYLFLQIHNKWVQINLYAIMKLRARWYHMPTSGRGSWVTHMPAFYARTCYLGFCCTWRICLLAYIGLYGSTTKPENTVHNGMERSKCGRWQNADLSYSQNASKTSLFLNGLRGASDLNLIQRSLKVGILHRWRWVMTRRWVMSADITVDLSLIFVANRWLIRGILKKYKFDCFGCVLENMR